MAPQPIRKLRDLTREREQVAQLLEDTDIKLSVVASDIASVSGRSMLEALISGDREPHVLADLAMRRLRNKIPKLTEALTDRFREHYAFLARPPVSGPVRAAHR